MVYIIFIFIYEQCSQFISLSAALIPLNIHLTLEQQAFTREYFILFIYFTINRGTPNDIPQLFDGLTTPKCIYNINK